MQKIITKKCPRCGSKFEVAQNHSKVYCSRQCMVEYKRDKATAQNRKFTKDTPYLAWSWHYREGRSYEWIGKVMDRTPENVEMAVKKQEEEYKNLDRGQMMKFKIMEAVVADNLRRYRREAGRTQREAAECLNISKGAYLHYESGRRVPKLEYLLELAKFYGVGVEKLIEGA